MGDWGRRRIDAPAERNVLRVSALFGWAAWPREGGASSAPPFHFWTLFNIRRRQRGQKPRGALRYSIAVTLRRIRI